MTTDNPEPEKDSVPFFPDHFMTELYVALGFIILAIIIGALGLKFHVGLEAPADQLNTPLHVKPEWYFLFLYQILKIIPPNILGIEGTSLGVVSVLVALVIAMLWPFIDKKEDTKKARWVRLIVAIVGVILVIALTIWGEVS